MRPSAAKSTQMTSSGRSSTERGSRDSGHSRQFESSPKVLGRRTMAGTKTGSGRSAGISASRPCPSCSAYLGRKAAISQVRRRQSSSSPNFRPGPRLQSPSSETWPSSSSSSNQAADPGPNRSRTARDRWALRGRFRTRFGRFRALHRGHRRTMQESLGLVETLGNKRVSLVCLESG